MAHPDDKSQNPQTDVTAGGSKQPSPNWEQPADDGAEVDPEEALAARKAERDPSPTKPRK
ncbi:MAG: hypothetical protein M3680_28310 [Myxococcota bacterium]|nr:hypothetical protein [Myxococcota bacterium]